MLKACVEGPWFFRMVSQFSTLPREPSSWELYGIVGIFGGWWYESLKKAGMPILCCCLKSSAVARWLSKWRLWRHAGGDAEWWCGRIWSELILVPGSSFSRQCSSDGLEETTIQRRWCEGRSRLRFCFRRCKTGEQHDQHELPEDRVPDSSDHNTVLESPWINRPVEKQFVCFPPFRYMKIPSRKSVKVCNWWHCLI